MQSSDHHEVAAGRFIISEKTGEWAMALRWAAGNLPLRLYETRSLWDCRQEILRLPASFVVLEVTPTNIENVVQLVAEVRQAFSLAVAVVVAQRNLEPYEDILREAGSLHVVFSPRRLNPVVRMAYQHLAGASQQQSSIRDSIRSRMPWGGE